MTGQSKSIVNYYEKIPKHLNTTGVKIKNENIHGLKPNFGMLIVGGTGSGKTNIIMNIIKLTQGTYNKIIICCSEPDQPLYNLLRENFDDEHLFICDDLEDFPSLEQIDKSKGQTLAIFDDLLLEKKTKKIEEYFIKGRHRLVTRVYLSQSYYGTPKNIRKNLNYLILKKLSNKKDIGRILSDYGMSQTQDEIMEIYKYCVGNGGLIDFMMIDLKANEDEKFRKNFDVIKLK